MFPIIKNYKNKSNRCSISIFVIIYDKIFKINIFFSLNLLVLFISNINTSYFYYKVDFFKKKNYLLSFVYNMEN
jgi:hypothetical protein